jgi:hypothetical protein
MAVRAGSTRILCWRRLCLPKENSGYSTCRQTSIDDPRMGLGLANSGTTAERKSTGAPVRKLVSTLGLFFFASVSSACNSGDELTSPLHARTSLALPVTTRTAQDETARSIGRAVAIALADSNLRRQLLEDLRDSPFREHSIHAQSYLLAQRGSAISRRTANAAGLELDDFYSTLRALPELEIGLSSSLDRLRWTGTGDVVVVATVLDRRERLNRGVLTAFDVNGLPVTVPLNRKAPWPVISILPVRTDFGSDPERVRAAARSKSGSTVSTSEEELNSESDCNDPWVVQECPDDGGLSGGWQSGVHAGTECTGATYGQVDATNDYDMDGIKDLCEVRIALGLQPELILHATEAYGAREPYWTVKRIAGEVKIMYLLAYYYDGYPVDHNGDSEFIILHVGPNTGDHWSVRDITTSAHWGACCGGDYTSNYTANGFWFNGAAAHVYVSRSHHGNYRMEYDCDDRIGDECSPPGSGNVQLVGVHDAGNIGNSLYSFDLDPGLANTWETPRDCTRSRISGSGRPGVECFFNKVQHERFSGWVGQTGDAATHYADILGAYGF